MKIVLIRHGETRANLAMINGLKLCIGCLNNEFAGLNQNGINSAKKLAENEEVKHINKVYVSNLQRAIDTAKLAKPNFEYMIIPNLRERSLGVFEGKTKQEIMQNPKYQKYYTNPDYMDFKDSFTQKAPEGENYTDVVKRVMEFLKSLDFQKNDSIGIFSHYCTIRCMFLGILKLEPKEKIFQLKIKNCEPYIFEGSSLENFKLTSHNLEEIVKSNN